MAKQAAAVRGLSIRLACRVFGISETCYRYQPKLSDENAEIADWLIRLTHNQRNWGFGLCFCTCATSKASAGTTSAYRIYRELELNLRIKPKKRIVREKPELLAVPETINQVWSMDFMHDSLKTAGPIAYSMSSMTSTVRPGHRGGLRPGRTGDPGTGAAH